MRALFSDQAPLVRFCFRLAQLLILNIIWMACSLPLFTFGAATAALYAALELSRGDTVGSDSLVRCFFTAFARCFKVATVFWAILLTALVALLLLSLGLLSEFRLFPAFALALGSVVWMIAESYLFALIARFDDGYVSLLQTAAVLSARHSLTTVMLVLIRTAVVALLIVLWRYMPSLLWLAVLFGGSGMAMLSTRLMDATLRSVA